MTSLLGQFYNRIKGSQEDIASEGLAYILQQSEKARNVLSKIIKVETGLDFANINYVTQNVGDKLERPDISGYNNLGKEAIILEAKFWASLTDNQPIEYLNRLFENSILVFVCPTLRLRSIYNELKIRLNKENLIVQEFQTSHSINLQNNKWIIIKSWNDLLQPIKIGLQQNNEFNLVSDIDQIIGFCQTIDSNSFLPLQSQDLSPSLARKIKSFYDIADKVVDELKNRERFEIKSLRSAASKYVYTRFFLANGLGYSVNMNFDLWANKADTPFWITVKDIIEGTNWAVSQSFYLQVKNYVQKNSIPAFENTDRVFFIPIYLKTEVTEDVLIIDIAEQIEKLQQVLIEANA